MKGLALVEDILDNVVLEVALSKSQKGIQEIGVESKDVAHKRVVSHTPGEFLGEIVKLLLVPQVIEQELPQHVLRISSYHCVQPTFWLHVFLQETLVQSRNVFLLIVAIDDVLDRGLFTIVGEIPILVDFHEVLDEFWDVVARVEVSEKQFVEKQLKLLIERKDSVYLDVLTNVLRSSLGVKGFDPESLRAQSLISCSEH